MFSFVSLQLVAAESSNASDTQSQCTDSQAGDLHVPTERVGGIGDSRPPSFQYVKQKYIYFITLQPPLA